MAEQMSDVNYFRRGLARIALWGSLFFAAAWSIGWLSFAQGFEYLAFSSVHMPACTPDIGCYFATGFALIVLGFIACAVVAAALAIAYLVVILVGGGFEL